MREKRPKYSPDRGTVNTMAERLMAAQPIQGAAQRFPFLGTPASQALFHRWPKVKIPRVERKENCSPALATA